MLPYVEFYFQFCCCCYYYLVLDIPKLFCCALSYLSKRKKKENLLKHTSRVCVLFTFFFKIQRIGWSMRNNKCLKKKKSSFPYSGFCRLVFFSSFFSFLNSLLFISVINVLFFLSYSLNFLYFSLCWDSQSHTPNVNICICICTCIFWSLFSLLELDDCSLLLFFTFFSWDHNV